MIRYLNNLHLYIIKSIISSLNYATLKQIKLILSTEKWIIFLKNYNNATICNSAIYSMEYKSMSEICIQLQRIPIFPNDIWITLFFLTYTELVVLKDVGVILAPRSLLFSIMYTIGLWSIFVSSMYCYKWSVAFHWNWFSAIIEINHFF